MPKQILSTLLFSLLVIAGGPASGLETQKDVQKEASESETAPQPEVPKHISTIMVEKNLLSVEFVNVDFGEILRSISQKAGFTLEGFSPAFGQLVTTKFNDLEMDKGIIRLFSLVKESNYLISYDEKGSVSKVKIPSAKLSSKTSSSVVEKPGGTQAPPRSRFGRRRSRSFIPQTAVPGDPSPVPQPAPPQPEHAEDEDAPDE
jgi:hypothetical protein